MDAGKKVIAPAVDTADMKVTAMVDDKRYREDKFADKYEAENNITHEDVKSIRREMPNEYLKRKADEAFARLG